MISRISTFLLSIVALRAGKESFFFGALNLEMIGFNSADRVAVLGEVELDGSRGVMGFKKPDLGLADTAEFLQGQSASVAVGGKIG